MCACARLQLEHAPCTCIRIRAWANKMAWRDPGTLGGLRSSGRWKACPQLQHAHSLMQQQDSMLLLFHHLPADILKQARFMR